MHELAELLTEGLLDGWSNAGVGSDVEASRGDFRGKPICFREAYDERDEVLLDLLLRELFADLVQGFDGLDCIVSQT